MRPCRDDSLLSAGGGASLPAIWASAKDEAGTANIVDHLNFAWPVHLVTQATHMYVDKVGRRHELVIPDLFQKHGSRQQLVASLHHVFKQTKLARQKINYA